MAIKIIKKRHVPDTTRVPAPIKTEAPAPAVYAPPPVVSKPKVALPLPPSQEAYMANPTAYTPPAPTACTFCKHPYTFPCHGESDRCMNRQFILDAASVPVA